ncbi:MAG: LPXTG cell wall anchor domain-containing protein [Lachnospiraceae bacterium]|nr:LPXTG cell wall anchor domain-containing protein [Lachnospiraceae bacterium]
MKAVEKLIAGKKRPVAGILAVVLAALWMRVPFPMKAHASDVWPQKSTAPFYCLDGGKSWRAADRYDTYKYDTLPAPLTDVQARRLFWGYPANWAALKEAAKKYDPNLYAQLASTVSGPNTVKYIKDDTGTKFAWVADNEEIERRAVSAMEQAAAEGAAKGKEAPQEISEATSEEKAVPFQVLPFSDGPGALDTEFKLGSEFIRDIAKIEPQSVWDNGSTGGNVGWLDASQDKNIAKSVMGENLYEVTWSGDSIRIHNNGSALANENAVGSTMSEEEKYNKTTVRYKITMRGGSGWYTEGSWSDDYLHEWMDFKACINAPAHQRLYKADIRIAPSDQVFYIVISQEGDSEWEPPGHGKTKPKLQFQIFRHEETFQANYHVRLKKFDDETEKPLKGSQFYLYERFEDMDSLSKSEAAAGLVKENLSFTPWTGFQVFSEGTTDVKGEITHTDTRSYTYAKTYCDGHPLPEWGKEESEEADEEEEPEGESAEQVKDANREAAGKWLELLDSCEKAQSGGTHFHWLADEDAPELVSEVLESGSPSKGGYGGEGAESTKAFEASGCRADCEETYEKFIRLRFTYTWKEIQARPGYILHGFHADDKPIELVTTNSSEAGAEAVFAAGASSQITENVWYTGNTEEERRQRQSIRTALIKNSGPGGGHLAGVLAFYLAEGGQEIKKSTVTSERGVWKTGWQKPASDTENSKKNTEPATASDAKRQTAKETASNAKSRVKRATASNAGEEAKLPVRQRRLFQFKPAFSDETEPDDNEWAFGGSLEDFQGYLAGASLDGKRHLKKGQSGTFSHCSGKEDCGDAWHVRDHRTEGRLHINKRDLDLYRKESDTYTAYGEAEGDATLEGAVYGLFAAEDLIHPDAELESRGRLSNTGIVYHKNDLVAVAATDEDGNADFLACTREPGVTYDYETGEIKKRPDFNGKGPINRYQENQERNGNCWIGRPLLLGSYYVKELSRSEGFELSVNGLSKKRTNYGTGFKTPEAAGARGTAVLSLSDISSSMEGEAGGGRGYDELPFFVTSTGTEGYELIFSGFPEGTSFYRTDSGEASVTGPHVTGSEERPVTDPEGNPVWKRAESGRSHVRYEPEYGTDGKITGQVPASRMEDQIIRALQIPEKKRMQLLDLEPDAKEELLMESLLEPESLCFVKAAVEEVLNRNGYETPVTADGICSQWDAPVYSRGVRKGEPDIYGQTTAPLEPALRTVYGAATAELTPSGITPGSTNGELIAKILEWYRENPEWSFGGIDSITREGDHYRIVLYAGASVRDSRRFFIRKEKSASLEVDRIYAVYENPAELRWVYQAYQAEGRYRYEVERRYYMGSGSDKRYYIDATLTPAMLVSEQGVLEAIRHRVMVYHKAGEEIIDYLLGDPKNQYRILETEAVDKIEITTETELVEKDVLLEGAVYDKKTGVYRLHVETEGTDSFGQDFSDSGGSLTLRFTAKLPQKKVRLTEADIVSLGAGNTADYRAKEEIGFAEYLLRFAGAALSVSTGEGANSADTYIAEKTLSYRGQTRISEDGETGRFPLQLLERPIKQKIKVKKMLSDGEAMDNFRFKVYLKSNLERLYCDPDGMILWTDKNGILLDGKAACEAFPELVPRLYTKKTGRRLLETVLCRAEDEAGTSRLVESYNYEKFFDAIKTADTDRWHNDGEIMNTSFKPFACGRFSGIRNTINSSAAAEENAKRSDAVRQFAVTWYLETETDKLKKKIGDGSDTAYADELYDQALYAAILKAEEYLAPFFCYDLDSLYEILWDSEEGGGLDQDCSTLAAGQFKKEGKTEYAYGISQYLPYGEYVLSEQQPYKPEYGDFPNRHYAIDTPKELSLPCVYETESEMYSSFYQYKKETTPNELAKKYWIRFNEEWANTHTEPLREYVILAHSHDGDFELYPYGLDREKEKEHCRPYRNPKVAEYYHYVLRSENASVEDNVPYPDGKGGLESGYGLYLKDNVFAMNGMQTAYDRRYAPMLVPWSVPETESEGPAAHTGFAEQSFLNRPYQARLRIEKLDAETGEPILHDDAVFALYRAERDERRDGDGSVKRYGRPTRIAGSREFLEAMGAEHIAPFARGLPFMGPGELFSGTVAAGTPICREKDVVIFSDEKGVRTGEFEALSTVVNEEGGKIVQTAGYLETPNPVKAGVYVLAELKTPAGYRRSGPIPVEIYSDAVSYYPDSGEEKAAAVCYPYTSKAEGNGQKERTETARIYVNDTATSLEVSKRKVGDTVRGMKVSGRVEGTITLLGIEYGLENLELAYNSAGQYQGFGWKKGTLEYLENRKAAGERVELVYENGVFQGYGYISKTLGTAGDENRYVAGAMMALYEAIEVRAGGDGEDYTFEGVEVNRDRNGNVKEILVKEGFAGQKTEFLQRDGRWKVRTTERKDTPVLFYDLGGLRVLETDRQGSLFGYDREGKRIKITADTDSVYALRGGRPVFEICGGDFSELVYDSGAKAFKKLDEASILYHLDEALCRDAQVDGYTGLAYIEKSGPKAPEETRYYVWPVTVSYKADGTVLAREKILTGRPGEIYAGTEGAYLTGSWNAAEKRFEKRMQPVYDAFGLIRYYKKSQDHYEKGKNIYDRDGDYVRYQYDDLLELYNRAAYTIRDHEALYAKDTLLWHRLGEAYLLPNLWSSGETTPQDGTDNGQTDGQADLLRRVMPGCYIMEELKAPAGYVKAMPVAVCVKEQTAVQRTAMADEKIKVEISKTDGARDYRNTVDGEEPGAGVHQSSEGSGAYTNRQLSGTKLALYRAERIQSMDFKTYPKGYYFVKKEETPAEWIVENPVDNSPISMVGLWITDGRPKYFEGIPAGDYILEELEAPAGYLLASMEITIKPTEKLQSFVLKDDHTKLEIFKYERKGQKKQALLSGACAELSLYPAVLNSDGSFCYEVADLIDSWDSADLSGYIPGMTNAYEAMFAEYEDRFHELSWTEGHGKTAVKRHAVQKESHTAGNGQIVTQLWETEEKETIRITAVRHDGRAGLDTNGLPRTSFAYQFGYKENFCKVHPAAVRYDTANGVHRIDRIPPGLYALVETGTPPGYDTAAPKLLRVTETGHVQRYEMENKKKKQKLPEGELVIKKSDRAQKDKRLCGAWFEAKNLRTGERVRAVTDETGTAVIKGLPAGELDENGGCVYDTYEVQEVSPPKGYRLSRDRWRVRFDEPDKDKPICTITAENEKTEFLFSKSSFKTGHFVEGARLSIYPARAEDGHFIMEESAVESWISGERPHRAVGTLAAGRTYFLVEEKVPDGYALAVPVRFSISWDGRRILHITDQSQTIRAVYEEGKEGIQALAVSGRSAVRMHYTLLKEGEELAKWQGTGGEWPITAKTAREGEVLTLCEQTEFSDGCVLPTGRKTFRLRFGEDGNVRFLGRLPVKHQFALKTCDGKALLYWDNPKTLTEYRIENRRKADGDLLFAPGTTFLLEEMLWLSDGSRLQTAKVSLAIHENGELIQTDLRNRETQVEIRKTDMTTGEELSGASLMLQEADGTIIEQWISGDSPHVFEARLKAGERYTLTEKLAPAGYETAEAISFTVSEYGEIEQVVMEDKKKEIPKEPEPGPQKPKPEEPKPEPESEPVPPKPDDKPKHYPPKTICVRIKPEEPKPQEERRVGRILASYQTDKKGEGILRLKQEGRKYFRFPKTGDDRQPGTYLLGLAVSTAMLLGLALTRRKRDER